MICNISFFKEHGSGEYFLLDHYVPESLLLQHEDEQALRKQMQLLHKERRGLDPGRAEEIYITLVQMLNGYSCHFYNAVWVRPMLELVVTCLEHPDSCF
jgi:tyrosine-protein phosphatase non-receptor type 13 protein